MVHRDVVKRYGVRRFGGTDAVRERVYAITVERRISNPVVKAITQFAAASKPQK